MNINEKNRKRLFWLLHSLGWFLLWGLELFVTSSREMTGLDIFMFSLTHLLGFLITLVLPLIYRRFYRRSFSMLKLSFAVLGVSLLTAFFWYYIDALISYMITPTEQFLNYYLDIPLIDAFRHFSYRMVPIIGWSALYFGLRFWLELRTERQRSAQALIEAQQARMQMLRYQLNPHFLFNTLGSVGSLIDKDPGAAREMINELTAFFRYSFIQGDSLFRPLEKELEALRYYFSIEKKRIGENIEVMFDIEKSAEKESLLSFIVQPLVENAIKFGMQTSPMPLRIKISANRSAGRLRISVSNTGKWLNSSPVPGDFPDTDAAAGGGLDILRRRLDNAYGNQYFFDITTNGVSVIVSVDLPVHKNSAD